LEIYNEFWETEDDLGYNLVLLRIRLIEEDMLPKISPCTEHLNMLEYLMFKKKSDGGVH
jgi:hypothetical protein